MVRPRPVHAIRGRVPCSSAGSVPRNRRSPLVHPPVGFISAGLPKRKWDGFFPVVSSETANRNRKRHKIIHDRLRGRIPDAPFTSPLEPSWVRFSVEETEIMKGKSFYGGPAYRCGRCEASFWFQERVESASAITKRRVVYNNCCKAGKVFIAPFKKPPEFLRGLLSKI